MSVKTIEVWEGEWVDLPEKSIGEIIYYFIINIDQLVLKF